MRGMSLVEVLVALVVLCVGMLALGHLLVEGLRTSRSALLRSHAVNLVADMSERIRAHRTEASAWACRTYPAGPRMHGCSAGAESGEGRVCSRAELAEEELAIWQQTARTVLPLEQKPCAADVEHVRADAPDEPQRYRITLSWREPGSDAPSSFATDLAVPKAEGASESAP